MFSRCFQIFTARITMLSTFIQTTRVWSFSLYVPCGCAPAPTYALKRSLGKLCPSAVTCERYGTRHTMCVNRHKGRTVADTVPAGRGVMFTACSLQGMATGHSHANDRQRGA